MLFWKAEGALDEINDLIKEMKEYVKNPANNYSTVKIGRGSHNIITDALIVELKNYCALKYNTTFQFEN